MIKALLRLIRSPYWLLLGITSVTFVIMFQGGLYNLRVMGIVFLVVTTTSAGGFAINDYFDRESDAIAKSHRPIPSKQIDSTRALQLSVLLFVFGIALSLAVNLLAFAVVAFTVLLLLLYSPLFKRLSGFLSNVVIGIIMLTVPLFSEAAALQRISVVSLSFVALTLWAIGRNVCKDIINVEGDVRAGYPTLVAVRGTHFAATVGALFCLFSIITSPFPYVMNVVSAAYLVPMVLWECALFYLILCIFKNPDILHVEKLLRVTSLALLIYPIALVSGTFFVP